MERDRRQSPHITLIGMSNIGKTYWAGRLAAEAGFEHVDCDVLIKQKLAAELKQDIADDGMAAWMGQPFEPQYAEASRKYLECENTVMESIIAKLRSGKLTRPLVIDTSGSLIYLNEKILQNLTQLTRVIYMESSTENIAELFKRYIEQPKPVIWGPVFAPRAGETLVESLKRCYPQLLNERARRYAQMASTKIPFAVHEDPTAKPDIFLNG